MTSMVPTGTGGRLSRRAFLRGLSTTAATTGTVGLIGVGPVIGLGSRAEAAGVGRGQHPLTKAFDASVGQQWIGVLYDANMRKGRRSRSIRPHGCTATHPSCCMRRCSAACPATARWPGS
jgi:hypothetical protein